VSIIWILCTNHKLIPMLKLVPLILPVVLCACAQLPRADPETGTFRTDLPVSGWLFPLFSDDKPTKLLICDVEVSRQKCVNPQEGLSAFGLGGLFLPLKVRIPVLHIGNDRADPQVVINGIPAACTKGSIHSHSDAASINISHVFCNWLGIGNVISNLRLTFDWEDPQSRTFGGRYVVKFIGTGNGSGSGMYTAQVQI